MRLLVLNWQDRQNPQAGGAEAHLHEVFGRLASRGHSITLLTSGWPGASPHDSLDGLDVHRVGSRYTFNLAAPPFYRRKLAAQPFDAIVEDLNKVPLFTPLWARHRLLLLVHHLFGRTAFEEAPWPLAAATWLLETPLAGLYRGVAVEAVSESTAQDLVARGFSRDTIRVIPNGVDVALYQPDPANTRFPEPTLLYLGRLKRYKRVDLIIRALSALRARGLQAHLVIGGRGDAEPALRALTHELNVADAVDFRGFVSEEEKQRLFQRAWVHVLTSPKEGWGITNLEAAACGTPTVASDSPGLRDSVVHGRTGFLVPHGDVPALAAQLETLLTDDSLRARLGVQARQFAEQFTWDRAASETEKHLEELTHSG